MLKNTFIWVVEVLNKTPDALWSYNIRSGKINISFATYPDAINNDGELFIVTFDLVGGNVGDNSTLVTFNLPDTTGVSGSASLATIHFTVTDTVGDTSVLDIFDVLLVDIWADEILST
ncbi:MAG: hypothetical protein K8R37_13770 [Bacteroidales bacterium]|nr:hypothetical protein [Bacteroidales bacterium]